MQHPRNIGGEVTSRELLSPRDQVDAASFSLEGPAVAKKDAHSALILVKTGPSTGTPDSMSVAAKLQHSTVEADGATWEDVEVSATNPDVTLALAAEESRDFIEVDLTKLREYFRLVFTVAHVGGATPATGLTAEAILGGLIHTPPTHE